jgi:hypothetical protein
VYRSVSAGETRMTRPELDPTRSRSRVWLGIGASPWWRAFAPGKRPRQLGNSGGSSDHDTWGRTCASDVVPIHIQGNSCSLKSHSSHVFFRSP